MNLLQKNMWRTFKEYSILTLGITIYVLGWVIPYAEQSYRKWRNGYQFHYPVCRGHQDRIFFLCDKRCVAPYSFLYFGD